MKKYLLFIVEGNNDKREIQAILRAATGSAFSENYVDAYHVHGGDLTTEKDSSEKTIIGKLNKIVLAWRNGGEQPYQRIVPSDVKKIIHVIDTDGVFIPEYSILETDDAKVKYCDESICYFDKAFLVGRNRKKARVIKKLLEAKQIDNIPYELFFASCNMDHLLFNEKNPLPNDKGRNAFIFAGKCKCKADLQDSVFSENICASGTYSDSWDMIQLNYNSLARHTNINLLLDAISEEHDFQ